MAQVVYFDARGCGRSTGEPSSSIEEDAADLDALREHLGLDRIVVLGMSYGGMVAIAHAVRYGSRVSNLVLIVTAASSRFIDTARDIVARTGNQEQQRFAARLFDEGFSSSEELWDFSKAMGPLYANKYDPIAASTQWERSKPSVVSLNKAFAGGYLTNFDFVPELSRIGCPTLVLAGADDWICAPEHSEVIAQAIPRAQLKVFAKSSHEIASDEPDEFRRVIAGFLTYPAT